jgi:membrane fusion protein (multidrug efflux system)
VIPEEAILPAGSEAFVYRLENGRAMRTKVETGIRRNGKVEILSGVQAGELVVTAGQLRLARDGMEVRVIEPAPTAAPKLPAVAAQPKSGG